MDRAGRGAAFGLWLAVTDWRTAQELSETDFAFLAGVHRSTVARLRTAVAPPRVRTVAAVAQVLGLDMGEAAELAGLGGCEVRQAITRSVRHTPAQRAALLGVLDAVERVMV